MGFIMGIVLGIIAGFFIAVGIAVFANAHLIDEDAEEIMYNTHKAICPKCGKEFLWDERRVVIKCHDGNMLVGCTHCTKLVKVSKEENE